MVENPLHIEMDNKLTRWLLRLHNKDGGFGFYPGKPSDVESTRFALATLNQLNYPLQSILSVRQWLKKLENRFVSLNLNGYTINYIYYWLMSAIESQIIPANTQLIGKYVLLLFRQGSAFVRSVNTETADLDSAFYALRISRILSQHIGNSIKTSTYLFIKRCQKKYGAFSLRPTDPADLNAIYSAVNLTSILRRSLTQKDSLGEWIKSCRIEEGFSIRPEGRCRLDATYWAIKSLKKIGINIELENIKSHIWQSHHVCTGGFSNYCNIRTQKAEIWPTYCAVKIISFV